MRRHAIVRSNQYVPLNWRVCVADIARQDFQVPGGLLGEGEEKAGGRVSWTERGDTAVRGLKEVASVAERLTECFVRLANVLQMSGQVVDEFERGEFALYLQHAA